MQVTLGGRFYSIVRPGSVRLDAGVLTGLGRSPLALDAYAWLTYRALGLGRETVVPWWSLVVQFGADYRYRRQFRRKFQRALETIKELCDGIDTVPREKRLLIRACASPVLSWSERFAAKSRAPFWTLAHKR